MLVLGCARTGSPIGQKKNELFLFSCGLRCPQLTPHRSFFPPMHVNDVRTFQDAGPLENDPLLWALAEAAALFPHAGQA
jgi:hypothetical protein